MRWREKCRADPDINSLYRRRSMLYNARRKALRYGRAVNITLEDISIPTHCPLLGIALTYGPGRKGPTPSSPSLDRIDNTKGYVKGNVWVISNIANTMKQELTVEEFRTRYLTRTVRPPISAISKESLS